MRALGILTMMLMLIGAAAAAEDITARAYVESDMVYMGETFVYQIVVSGTVNATPPDPSAFGPDFFAQFLGGQNSSSQSISVINGKMQREVHQDYVMQFNLTPKRKGQLTIPSVTVKVKGQAYGTNPVKIGVDTPAETQDFKLVMSLSRASCYVGEPVVLTVTWYIARDVDEFGFTMPLLGDQNFNVQIPEVKIDPNERYYQISLGSRRAIAQKGMGMLNGVYTTTMSFKMIVFPTRAGTLTIPQASVECGAAQSLGARDVFDAFRNDNFFGARRPTKKYVVPSNTPTLVVKELPEEGKPANFAGHIGEYRISASASPLDVSVGDPITLKITLSGPEYLENVNLPRLTDQAALATYFKIADERAVGKTVGKTKVFTQTIRAKNENVKEIPPVTLSYFDTKKARYETVSTAPIPIVVHATKLVTAIDAEGTATGPLGSPLEGWKQGIAYNYEGPAVLRTEQSGLASALRSPAWLAALFLPFASYVALLATTVTRRRREADVEGRMARGAFRHLKRRLDAIRAGGASGAQLSEQVLSAIRTYLGDRFSTAGSTLTKADVVRILGERGVPDETVEALRAVVSECEAGVYAGDDSPAADPGAFIKRALEAARALEKAL